MTLWEMNGGDWYQESTRGERLQIDERLIAVASCR
jgi:serine/threonine protein phosphatase 1